MRKPLLLAVLLAAGPALSADFTGSWSSVDKVCKYACTKENPEPDFEVRISITLVQRGKIVCGYRYQNTLADKVFTSPLRGQLTGKILEVEEGEPEFGEIEEGSDSATGSKASGYPFRIAILNRFRLSPRGMAALTERGSPYMVFTREPFSSADKSRFLQESNAYLAKCFSYERGK